MTQCYQTTKKRQTSQLCLLSQGEYFFFDEKGGRINMTRRLLKSNVVNEQPVVLMELNFPGLNELSMKDVASYDCRINTSFEKPEKNKKRQKIEEGQILFCFQR